MNNNERNDHNSISCILIGSSISECNYLSVHASEDRVLQKNISDNEYDQPSVDQEAYSQMMKKPTITRFDKSNIKIKQLPKSRSFNLGNILKKKLFGTANNLKYFINKIKSHVYLMPRDLKIREYLTERYLSKNYRNSQFQTNENSTIRIQLFKSSGIFLLLWQTLMILISTYLMWWLPFESSFIQQNTVNLIDNIVIGIYILDILIKLNQEIIDQGEVVTKRKLIILFYLRNHFIFDLVNMLSFAYMVYTKSENDFFVKIFLDVFQFIMNIIKFRKIISNYRETFDIQATINELINLIELILLVYFFAHFMACIWYLVGNFSLIKYPTSWTSKFELEKMEIFSQYMYSFYWATTTMVTVGYGDISAQNLYEIIAATILMFFASAVFGFSINSIGMILQNLENQEKQFKKNISLINQYMVNNKVNQGLQNKVRNYLRFLHNQQIQFDTSEVQNILYQTMEVIESLSINLKKELVNDVQKKVIDSSIFIINNFSVDVQKEIASNLEPVHYAPKEIIYEQNVEDPCCLYILLKGEVSLVDKHSGQILNTFKNFGTFGVFEVITGLKRYCNAIANEYSQLYRISRQKFMAIITHHDIDFQQFHNLRQSILLKENVKFSCFACRGAHLIWDCKYLFYKPNIERVIKKDIFHSYQGRMKFKRYKRPRYGSRVDFTAVNEAAQVYQEHNNFQSQNHTQTQTLLRTEFDKGLSNIQSRNQIHQSKVHFENIRESLNDSINQKRGSQNLLDDENRFQNLKKKRQSAVSLYKHNKINYQDSDTSTHRNHYDQKDPNKQFISLDIDKMRIFARFQIQNNANTVIEKYNLFQKVIKKKSLKFDSKYDNYCFLKMN